MPANGKTNGRFELPQFTPLNFSLTDGTDIPPPLASPIEDTPPPPPPAPEAKEPAEVETPAMNGTAANGIANGNGTHDSPARTNGLTDAVSMDDRPPMSPISTNRPGSIRRFLSRNKLNSFYEDSNGSHDDLGKPINRPESSMSFASTKLDKKGRPSWFRRFSSNNGGNRSSVIMEENKVAPKPKGPPPPKLPELSKLRAQIPEDDEGSLGGADLFKNIK